MHSVGARFCCDSRDRSYLSRNMTKPTKWVCAQQRLRSAWSESLLCAHWVAKEPCFLHADSEDSDQTGQIPRLIWVFTGANVILFVLSWRGSFWRAWRTSNPSLHQTRVRKHINTDSTRRWNNEYLRTRWKFKHWSKQNSTSWTPVDTAKDGAPMLIQ